MPESHDVYRPAASRTWLRDRHPLVVSLGVMLGLFTALALTFALPGGAYARTPRGDLRHAAMSTASAARSPARHDAVQTVFALGGGTTGVPPATVARALPQICRLAAYPNGGGEDRFGTCARSRGTLYVFDLRTRKVLGKATFDTIDWDALNVRSRRWQHGVVLTLIAKSGELAAGNVSVRVALDCRNCGASAAVVKLFTAFDTDIPWSHRFTVNSPGGRRELTSQTPKLILTAVGVPANPATGQLTTLHARCDSSTGVFLGRWPAGCINPGVIPTFVLSDPRVPTVIAHIRQAQLRLKHHWGLQGAGPPLHRSTHPDRINANRKRACGRRKPPPRLRGVSCDEYPFASTMEGAATNPDFSWAWVSASQNNLAGSLTIGFYSQNRILNGDPFWVAVP